MLPVMGMKWHLRRAAFWTAWWIVHLCRPGQAWALGTHERRMVRVRVLAGGFLALPVVEGDV
jgi:hypothetical protein